MSESIIYVSELAYKILQDELEIGEPWKLPKGTGFVLPILQKTPSHDRNYVLLQEVRDRVEFTDTGIVEKIKARNRSGFNVFIRKGTILSGKDHQDRSPVAGIVLEPIDEIITIPVNCIRATVPVSHDAAFFVEESVVPHTVYADLGDQSRTWNRIREHGESVISRFGAGFPTLSAHLSSLQGDDLVERMRVIEGAKGTVEDVLKQIPGDHIHQIGIAIFDLKGVVAVETFDHPTSWRAFSESIIRSYVDVLTGESELYEIKVDKAIDVLKQFLKKAANAVKTVITTNNISTIWDLHGEDLVGEIAEIGGREIHTILSRTEGTKNRRSRGYREPFSRATLGLGALYSARSPNHTDLPSSDWLNRRGSAGILGALSKQDLRFNELVETTDAARGTVNTRLREAREMGLVTKRIREENGNIVYALTPLGEVTEKKKLLSVTIKPDPKS